MESVYKDIEHLKIPHKEIISATKNFDESNVIGSGGFGKVYVGELGHNKVAIKLLDRKHGQGGPDFWAEISSLAWIKHENLIHLLGYCDEGNEEILVYEYASTGSLDRLLSSTNLTWAQRLKICIDAARGLSYLHGEVGSHKHTIIHRDIKSSNILLDSNWKAKVSDFGLTKMAPANEQHTSFPISNFDGTLGYCDPLYLKTNTLTRESDVYSFGVVLFEVLSGRLCFEISTDQVKVIVPVWKENYKKNKIQEIVFDDLKPQMHPSSLKIFSDIAYQCLQETPEERPHMVNVVKELEVALNYQKLRERRKLPELYKEMLMITAEDPLNNIPETELKTRPHKGILLNRGQTWVSVNMDGEYREMISIAECLTSTASECTHYERSSEYISRFAVGCYEPGGAYFETHVRTQYLSPRITYTVNLVFKNKSENRYIGLKYNLKGEQSISYSFLSDEREDGWLTAELYQFTSDQRAVDLEICLDTEYCPTIIVESIEFRPMEKVEHEVLTDDNTDMQLIADTETYWEEKLPIDYKDIIKRSKDRVQWENKKDLYSILCKGFLLSYGEEWFYLGKEGKKCIMLPARAALEEDRWKWKPEPETRFKEAADCDCDTFDIFCKFSSKMLSPQTTYAAYLAYKLPYHYIRVDQPRPVKVVDKDLDWDSDSDSDSKEVQFIFLRAPQTPVISWRWKKIITFNTSSRPKIKGLPKQRSDGWMEVQVHEFQTRAAIKMISTRLNLYSHGMSLKGITVQGVEFRPI